MGGGATSVLLRDEHSAIPFAQNLELPQIAFTTVHSLQREASRMKVESRHMSEYEHTDLEDSWTPCQWLVLSSRPPRVYDLLATGF